MSTLSNVPSLRCFSQAMGALLVGLSMILGCSHVALAQGCPTNVTYPGNEAPLSQLKLQMPFVAGETWTVGDLGSFYGNNYHCNTENDHYATDWNRPGDDGASVLAVADGTISWIRNTNPCPAFDYGCYVQIDHAGGYQTLYGHLKQVEPGLVVYAPIKAGTRIGLVGKTGNAGNAEHLHLTFRQYGIEGSVWGYYSHCNTSGSCAAGESLRSPQGPKPSLMMTQNGGSINLVDKQSYTSVNGRIYLPNFRSDNGWQSTIRIKNMAANTSVNVTIQLYPVSGAPCGVGYATIAADQRLDISGTCPGGYPVAERGYISADQEIAVIVTNERTSPVVKGGYTGVPATATWGPSYIPLVAKNRTTNSGVATSDILIQNVTNQASTAQIRLIQPGTTIILNQTISAFGSWRYRLDSDSNVPNEWIGSAVITPTFAGAGASFAVSSDFFTWDRNTDFALNSAPPENKTTEAFIPLFMVRRSGITGVASTPISVQNVSTTSFGANDLKLECWADPQIWPPLDPATFTKYNNVPLAPNESFAFNPTDTLEYPNGNWQGYCRLKIQNQTTPPKQFITMAQIRYPANNNASAYEALPANGLNQQAYFPVIEKRLTTGAATAIVVQNLSQFPANTTFVYKAAPTLCPGSVDVTVSFQIPAFQSTTHNHRVAGLGGNGSPGSNGYHGLPDYWCGSLHVISDRPIDGFGQLTNYLNASGDSIMAYNAITHP